MISENSIIKILNISYDKYSDAEPNDPEYAFFNAIHKHQLIGQLHKITEVCEGLYDDDIYIYKITLTLENNLDYFYFKEDELEEVYTI